MLYSKTFEKLMTSFITITSLKQNFKFKFLKIYGLLILNFLQVTKLAKFFNFFKSKDKHIVKNLLGST